MSEIKVNKITPRVACGTTQLGDSGDTITIPSGATISNLGTATGFGGTGVVSWDTASIKTTGFTAVTGTGYFCNTTGGGFTVTLPLSPSAGDVVGVSDYAKTWDTDNLTLNRNSENIGGAAINSIIVTKGLAVTLVYVDATKGWIVTDSGNQSDTPTEAFMAATGGCVTTCGDYKIHTFLSPNSFCVSAVGNPCGSDSVDYLVIGGGGAGGPAVPSNGAGGGGAGGYRESPGTVSGSYAVSPLGVSPAAAVPVSVTAYPITVGGGGAATPAGPGATQNSGCASTFSTITSAGGGAGGIGAPPGAYPGIDGGSGGGGGGYGPHPGATCGGSGDTPPTPVAQGTDGGAGSPPVYVNIYRGGGGGGATVVGEYGGAAPGIPFPSTAAGGDGGCGATSSINTVATARAGGGGGGCTSTPNAFQNGAGGAGGGGAGAGNSCAVAGTINTGSGGGGGGYPSPFQAGAGGGSGIVILRYKYQ